MLKLGHEVFFFFLKPPTTTSDFALCQGGWQTSEIRWWLERLSAGTDALEVLWGEITQISVRFLPFFSFSLMLHAFLCIFYFFVCWKLPE